MFKWFLELAETGGLDVMMHILCRIKITGLLPEDAESTPVVPTSSSTPDLTKKPGNFEGACVMLCSSVMPEFFRGFDAVGWATGRASSL